MPISLDGKTYHIKSDVITSLNTLVLAEYSKLDETFRFLGKGIAREILRRMENDVLKKTGDKEKALTFRPDRKQDSVIFFIEKMTTILAVVIEHADINITTDESGLITGVEVNRQAGGPLVTDGNIRQRQDDSTQISG